MFSSSLLTSPNYVLRIRCLLPQNSSPSSTLLLKPINTDPMITTTTTKAISSTSFGFDSPKASRAQPTCNVCARLLYSFEEILACRVCHGAYHWRCVRPDTISHYGENTQYVCDKCNTENATTRTVSSTHRLPNGGIRIKSPNLTEIEYREFASIPSKLNSVPTKETNVGNTIRYFEGKQQQQTHQLSKSNDFNGIISTTQMNGHYIDDAKTIHQTQQQQNGLDSDEEHTSEMFQANYEYTPLKEYAAMKGGRTTHDINTNAYQFSPPTAADHQLSSQYNTDFRYQNSDYELGKSPLHPLTPFTSPTVDNLSIHNRHQHFISTTNLNTLGTSAYRDTKNSLNYSTPYLSQVRDNDSGIFKQTDRHSAVGSDSGIVMVNSNHQHQTNENNQVMEQKLTDLVQKLGHQLETDAQKLSEKLEIKLKSLEHMIDQQTYVIRRQDEVIERLKSKILHIETERDRFRDRLSMHEQREKDDKYYLTSTGTGQFNDHKTFEHDDQQQTLNDVTTSRKYSNASSTTTETSKVSSKKSAAPRASYQGNETAISKLIKTSPLNQDHGSSSPSIVSKLVSATPLIDRPAAASRLDDMIHQSNINDETHQTSAYYNTADTHYHDDEQSGRKRSSSSSSASSASTSVPADTYELTPTKNARLSGRNSNLHRSLESIPRKTSQAEQGLTVINKATSLQFGTQPVRFEDPSSIYVTTSEAPHPASDYQDVVKGWLRKQNRDSFFKRVERYYCVLTENTILMHKNEKDRRAQKAVNLIGARVRAYNDLKYGPSLELTWSKRNNAPTHYHLYAPNPQDAERWATGIEAAIQKLNNKNTKWKPYRMNT